MSSVSVSPMSVSPDRRICIVADDFGLHQNVDSACLALIELGHLQGISCMAGGPSWRASAPQVRDLPHSAAEIGLHLDLTERPLTLPRQALSTVIARAYLRQLDSSAIRAEIRAQLNEFESQMGRAPDYIDGHQHIHQLPVIRDALLAEIESRYPVGLKPWLRNTVPGWSSERSFDFLSSAHRKASIIGWLGARALNRTASERGVATSPGLLGVYGFDQDSSGYTALLRLWIAHARDGALVMCHPALGEVPSDAIAAARQTEYQVLTGPTLPDLLSSTGVRQQLMKAIIGTPGNSHLRSDDGSEPEDSARSR
jgi:predicted glycoside hydrolase/deacetylase ChbG (UPF0249 family)